MTKVSLPVSMNEPLSGLQRNAEVMVLTEGLMNQAAQEEDPIKRMALTTIAFVSVFNNCKIRKRKPFDSFIGETYELVTPTMKLITE